MNQNEEHIQHLEITIEQAKEQIKLAEALERLHNNADFKKIILKGYFEENSQRTVMMLAAAGQEGDKEQKALHNVLTGIGQLAQYFHKTFTFGENASRAIEESTNTRADIMAEEANNNVSELVN